MKKSSKRMLVFLLLLVVLAMGGYYALWNAQATKAKEVIEQAIARWNGENPWLTYESIAAVGFPSKVAVEIRQPKISLQVDEVFKTLGSHMPVSPDGTDTATLRETMLTLPPWHEELLLEGAVQITVNLLSDTYGINTEGDYIGKSNLNNEVTEYAVKAASGKRQCTVHFERGASNKSLTLWDWDYLSGDMETLAAAFRRLECDTPGYELHLQHAGQVFTISEVPFLFATEIENGKRNILLRTKVASAQGNKAFDAFIGKYYSALNDGAAQPLQYQLAQIGKNSFEIDLTMDGIPENGVVTLQDDFKLALNRFTSSTDIGNMESHFILENNVEGEQAQMNLDAMVKGKATEAAYRLYVEDAKQQGGILYDSLAQEGSRPALSREEFTSHAGDMVPQWHQWGDASFILKGNALASPASYNAELEQLEINTIPYGLTGSGTGEYPQTAMFPTGKLDLSCRNCITWVEDVVNWWNNAIQVYNATITPPQLTAVSDALKEGIKQFMLALSGGTAEQMQFAITNDKEGSVNINGKDIVEVMALFQEHIASKMATPAAPVHLEEESHDHTHDGEAHE